MNAGTLTTILVLATLVEALVEYLVKPLVKPEPGAPAPEAGAGSLPEHTVDLVLRYSAAVAGLVLCVIYRADLLHMIGLTTSIPFAGEIVTGLLIGRGANYVHDFASRWLT